jgi:hypothetical protein
MSDTTTTTRLQELLAEAQRIKEERDDAQRRLDAAEEAVLKERFKDFDQYHEGDIILVPRKLFGEKKWWPAQILAVRLNYSEGRYADTYKPDPGGHWENLSISYTVRLQAKDGTFTGKNDGFYHNEVQPYRGEQAQ